MKRLVPLLGLLVCVGCMGPSVEGTWNVTPGEPLPYPVTPTIQATFAKEGKGSCIIKADSEMPFGGGSVKLEADVTGTWAMEGDKLTWTPQSATIKPELNSVIADPIKKEVQSSIGNNASGKVKWEGNDKFTVTTENGKTATFDRVKS